MSSNVYMWDISPKIFLNGLPSNKNSVSFSGKRKRPEILFFGLLEQTIGKSNKGDRNGFAISKSVIACAAKIGNRNLEKKQKPEKEYSGFLREIQDSKSESGTSEISNNLTLPVLQNSDKQNGEEMTKKLSDKTQIHSDEGFIKLPRSLLNDPRYQGARLKYQKVLHTILKHAAFKPTFHAIGVKIISIGIGQLCISERNLVDLCNEGVKFKEDFVDKNIVRRAVHFWRTCQYLNHEVIHDKTIITIKIPDIYEINKNICEPESEPKVNQNRTTNEERKERKEVVFEKETNKEKDFRFVDSSLINLNFESEKPSKKKNQTSALNVEEKKILDSLWDYCVKNQIAAPNTKCGKPGVKQIDIQVWIRKYNPKDILESLKKAKDEKINKTYGSYVSWILREKIVQKAESQAEGRKFVKNAIKKYDMKHIEMLQDYFVDHISNDQNYYHLPIQTLNEILKISYKRAQQKESEDSENEKHKEFY